MGFYWKRILDPVERFWAKVDRAGPDDCWIFRGHGGYGQFWFQGRGHPAARVSFFLAHGHWPLKGFACHHCDVRRCVNPRHLFDGSARDNVLDCVRKGRWGNGSSTRRSRNQLS